MNAHVMLGAVVALTAFVLVSGISAEMFRREHARDDWDAHPGVQG